MVTHGINVKAYADMAYDQYRDSDAYSRKYRVQMPKVVDYTGIASSTIRGRSIRIASGGTSQHLDNEAAERYLERKAEKARKVQNEKNEVSGNTNDKK